MQTYNKKVFCETYRKIYGNAAKNGTIYPRNQTTTSLQYMHLYNMVLLPT